MLNDIRLRRITRIFRENGWFNTQRSEIVINDALDRSFEVARLLNDEQFDLFCILLSNYMFIEYEQYIAAFERVLAMLVPSLDQNHKYRLLPLIAPKDKNKVKSGNNQLYLFAHTIWDRSPALRRFSLSAFSNTEEIKKQPIPKKPFTTIVVDDFIGSGDTAKQFLEDYSPNRNKNERIVFICLVAMQAGVGVIQRMGCEILYDKIAPKGIADCSNFPNKELCYGLMQSIEEKIRIDKKYCCGYGASEALVTMQRTPNNTFPLFWAKSHVDGTDWPSLFPRYR